MPARSRSALHGRQAGRPHERGDLVRLPLTDLECDERRACRGLGHEAADDVEAVRARRTARRAARGGRCPAPGAPSRRRRADWRGRRRPRRPRRRAGRRGRTPTSRPRRWALACATASASPDTSVREHVEVGALVLERERDRPRAGPDVDDPRALGQLEAHLDEQLGLRSRDQHARVDGEVDVAEALRPQQVGDRLVADGPPLDEIAERAHRRAGDSRRRSSTASCGRRPAQRRAAAPRRDARSVTRTRRWPRPPSRGRRAPAPLRPWSADGVRLGLGLERAAALVGLQRGGELVELAGQHGVQVVLRQPDAVVGDPALAVVVGPDPLGAVAACPPAPGGRRRARPSGGRPPARTGARAGRASPSRGSAAATSRPASRPRGRSACA